MTYKAHNSLSIGFYLKFSTSFVTAFGLSTVPVLKPQEKSICFSSSSVHCVEFRNYIDVDYHIAYIVRHVSALDMFG